MAKNILAKKCNLSNEIIWIGASICDSIDYLSVEASYKGYKKIKHCAAFKRLFALKSRWEKLLLLLDKDV